MAAKVQEEPRSRAESLRRTLQLVVDLAEARLAKAEVLDNRFTFRAALPLYAVAFRSFGLDLEGGSTPAEAAAALRGTVARNEVLAALEDWAFLAGPGEMRERLRAAADEIEARGDDTKGSLWRELQRAMRREDAAELQRLAMETSREPLSAGQALLAAKAFERSGRIDAAVGVLRAARWRFRSDLWVNHELGMLLANRLRDYGAAGSTRTDLEEATSCLEVATAVRPDSPGVWLNLGLLLTFQSRFAEADAAFRKAIALDPSYAAAHTALGNVLRSPGGQADAEAAHRKAIASDPRSALPHMNLAVFLAGQGRHDEAEEASHRAVLLDPRDPRTHYSLGIVLVGRGKYAEAEAACRQAVALGPHSAGAHITLGVALGRQGRNVEAEAACRRAAVLEPRSPLPFSNLGNALQGLGRFAEAEAACRQAIALDPRFAAAHANLGDSLRSQRRFAEAEAACRQAIALDPRGAHFHCVLSATLIDQGKQVEAEAASRQAIALNPQLAQAHISLGVVLQARGKFGEAETVNRRAIALDPRSTTAHTNLGVALRSQGKLEEAEAAFGEASRFKTALAETHVSLAQTLRDQGQIAESESALRQAIRLNPDHAEAHCKLGLLLGDQCKFADALTSLQFGHQLGSRTSNWKHPSAQWVREHERLVELERSFVACTERRAQPTSAEELLELARFGTQKLRRYVKTAELVRSTLEVKPDWFDMEFPAVAYFAAAVAAMAALGEGDSAPLQANDRSAWRRQSLAWLLKLFDRWERELRSADSSVKEHVQKHLKYILLDGWFAGVRGDGLGRLPESEREPWRKIWIQRDLLAEKARRSNVPAAKKEDR